MTLGYSFTQSDHPLITDVGLPRVFRTEIATQNFGYLRKNRRDFRGIREEKGRLQTERCE